MLTIKSTNSTISVPKEFIRNCKTLENLVDCTGDGEVDLPYSIDTIQRSLQFFMSNNPPSDDQLVNDINYSLFVEYNDFFDYSCKIFSERLRNNEEKYRELLKRIPNDARAKILVNISGTTVTNIAMVKWLKSFDDIVVSGPYACSSSTWLAKLFSSILVDFSEHNQITDAGLTHLQGVHTINLCDCRQITDAGLTHLSGVHTCGAGSPFWGAHD